MQTFEMHTFGLFAKRFTMQLSLCLSSEESFILIALTRTVSVWVSLNNLKIFHPHQSFAVRFPSQTDCWRPFVVRRVTIRESQSESLNLKVSMDCRTFSWCYPLTITVKSFRIFWGNFSLNATINNLCHWKCKYQPSVWNANLGSLAIV